MISIDKLAKRIKDAVQDLFKTDDATTYKFQLDGDLAIYVGWSSGFDPEDSDLCHSKSQPEYCINVKIAENAYGIDIDYPWVCMPWDKESGEVYDTDCCISSDTDYRSTAKWLLDSYKDIRQKLDDEQLAF